MSKVLWDNPDIGSAEIDAALSSLKSTIGAKGSNVIKLQEELQIYLDVKHVICVNNGTSALLAACLALKHKFGELKFAVPSFSFIASANAPSFVYEDIEFCDVDPLTWNVKSNLVPDEATAIMAVDVAGLPCDYDDLKKLSLPIIGDSAESLGSRLNNNLIGTQADIHCFSMHRSKIITCGEGGFVSTNSDELASYMRSYISHGYDTEKKDWEYKHKTLGLNFRMTDIEAAIARVQLSRINEFIVRRNKIAEIYRYELRERFEFQEFDKDKFSSNYFMFGILDYERKNEEIIEHLNKNNVITKAWSTIAGQECYRREDPTVCKKLSEHMVLLPIANATTDEEVEKVIKNLKQI